MGLTRVERERIKDSRLKLQSVSNSLKEVDPEKIEDMEQIEECLEDAERNLREALKTAELEH